MFWKSRPSPPRHLRAPGSDAPPLPRDAFYELLTHSRGSDGDASAAARHRYFATYWEMVWSMETWSLLPDPDRNGLSVGTGKRRGGTPPQPLVVEVSIQRGSPALGEAAAPPAGDPEARVGTLRLACVFSSSERADAAIARLGLIPPGMTCPPIELPLDQACNLLTAMPDVDGILFNPDELAWTGWLRLRDLAATFERRFDRLTPRMFGRFAEAVNRSGAKGRSRLIQRLLASSEWWFVATAERPRSPAMVRVSRGGLAVPLYTDAERARRGGPLVVAAQGDGGAVPIPSHPIVGASYLRRVHERARKEVLAVIVNDVPDDVGEPAPIPIDELLAAAEHLGW